MSLDTIRTTSWREAGRHCIRWAALPALVLLLAGAYARPAEAGDEFEDAFKYELGRIAAHEAAYVGRHVLGTLVAGAHPYGPGPARAYPVYVAVPEARPHHHHGRRHGHYRGRGHWRDRHHRHDHRCGHH